MTLAQVKEFNNLYEVERATTPTTRVPADKLRYSLIKEEFEELLEAIENFDLVEIADALGDIQYVTHGAIDVFNLEEVVNELPEHNNLPQYSNGIGIADAYAQETHLTNLKDAILTNNVRWAARILKDILRDVVRSANYFGIDLEYVVSAIHKSNLTKLGENGEVLRRPEDNKVIKGQNYMPPTGDIRAYLYDGVKDADLL